MKGWPDTQRARDTLQLMSQELEDKPDPKVSEIYQRLQHIFRKDRALKPYYLQPCSLWRRSDGNPQPDQEPGSQGVIHRADPGPLQSLPHAQEGSFADAIGPEIPQQLKPHGHTDCNDQKSSGLSSSRRGSRTAVAWS